MITMLGKPEIGKNLSTLKEILLDPDCVPQSGHCWCDCCVAMHMRDEFPTKKCMQTLHIHIVTEGKAETF